MEDNQWNNNTHSTKQPSNLFELFHLSGGYDLTQMADNKAFDNVLIEEETMQAMCLLLQSLIPENSNTLFFRPLMTMHSYTDGQYNSMLAEYNKNQTQDGYQNLLRVLHHNEVAALHKQQTSERLQELKRLLANNTGTDKIVVPFLSGGGHWQIMLLNKTSNTPTYTAHFYDSLNHFYRVEPASQLSITGFQSINTQTKVCQRSEAEIIPDLFMPLALEVQKVLGRIERVHYGQMILQGCSETCGYTNILTMLCLGVGVNYFDLFPTVGQLIQQPGGSKGEFGGYKLSPEADKQWRMQILGLLKEYLQNHELQQRVATSCEKLFEYGGNPKGQELLAENGYQQYEISAYSQTNRQCQHNLNYWLFGDYLGIGAGAHSKITDIGTHTVTRYWKVKHPKTYLDTSQPLISDQSTLSERDLALEFMLNALRLARPIPWALFTERTGLKRKFIEKPLEKAIGMGLIALSDGAFSVTPLGQRYLNDTLALF